MQKQRKNPNHKTISIRCLLSVEHS